MNQDDTQKDIHEEESVDTDELVFEEETENTAPDLAKKIRTLQKKVADLEAKNAELLLNWQKDKADFVNLRRKDEEAKKDIISFARKNMVAEVLPVLESFESAMKNKEVWEKVDHN